MDIVDVIRYLNIENNEMRGEKNDIEIANYLFEKFIQKIYFDTTTNFLCHQLFIETEELYQYILEGNGCNCQEEYFLFKRLLNHYGVESQIVHADVYDYKKKILKHMYSTGIVLMDRGVYIHYDLIRGIKLEIIPYEDNHYEISYDENKVKEVFYLKKDELYRVKRLFKNYKNENIMPFGIVSPFYWLSNPDRRIHYQPFLDKVRLIIDGVQYDLDTLNWMYHEHANWLSNTQKMRVNKCIALISYNIDDYGKLNFIERNFEFL